MGRRNAGVGPGERHRDATAQAQCMRCRCRIAFPALPPYSLRPTGEAAAETDPHHARARLCRRLQVARPARSRGARARSSACCSSRWCAPSCWCAPMTAWAHSAPAPTPRCRRSRAEIDRLYELLLSEPQVVVRWHHNADPEIIGDPSLIARESRADRLLTFAPGCGPSRRCTSNPTSTGCSGAARASRSRSPPPPAATSPPKAARSAAAPCSSCTTSAASSATSPTSRIATSSCGPRPTRCARGRGAAGAGLDARCRRPDRLRQFRAMRARWSARPDERRRRRPRTARQRDPRRSRAAAAPRASPRCGAPP